MSTADTELTARQLAELAGVSLRTLRAWTAQGLLDPPAFRGPSTRYTRAHRLKVLAIRALREQGLRLPDIEERLAGATLAELEALAGEPAPSADDAPRPALREPTYPAERWERVVLVPGLEIHVHPGAGLALRRLAQEIYDHYGPPTAASPPPTGAAGKPIT